MLKKSCMQLSGMGTSSGNFPSSSAKFAADASSQECSDQKNFTRGRKNAKCNKNVTTAGNTKGTEDGISHKQATQHQTQCARAFHR
jgi:hypothetical protein